MKPWNRSLTTRLQSSPHRLQINNQDAKFSRSARDGSCDGLELASESLQFLDRIKILALLKLPGANKPSVIRANDKEHSPSFSSGVNNEPAETSSSSLNKFDAYLCSRAETSKSREDHHDARLLFFLLVGLKKNSPVKADRRWRVEGGDSGSDGERHETQHRRHYEMVKLKCAENWLLL